MDSIRSICERTGGGRGLYPDGRPYYSLGLYLKRNFGRKLYKLSLDGGMTCPNRDGTVGYGGCIFCSAGGSGDFAADRGHPVKAQIAQAKIRQEKKMAADREKSPGAHPGYIAYFQAYTNTYGPVDYLSRIFHEAMEEEDVEVLSIATRPDCLGDEVMELLDRLGRRKPVWVELGLQTIHEETARRIRRGYELPCFEEALKRLQAGGHTVIAHMILGLPGETPAMMEETARYLGEQGIDGVKLQLLHVLKGTELEDWYRRGDCPAMEKEAYFAAVGRCLQVLPRNTVIHRITGDGPKNLLLAPSWSLDKKRVLNELHHYLKEKGIVQGSRLGRLK